MPAEERTWQVLRADAETALKDGRFEIPGQAAMVLTDAPDGVTGEEHDQLTEEKLQVCINCIVKDAV